MRWNYRVLCLYHEGVAEYAIHEVYYDDDDESPVLFSEHPAFPSGADLKELEKDLVRYGQALALPVLTEADFPRETLPKALKNLLERVSSDAAKPSPKRNLPN